MDQGKHWLYRFWTRLPVRGQIAIFDRSWYGRVLVERVEKLAAKEAWQRAYREIKEFEAMLVNDGVDLVKIFLGISKQEQLKRFKERFEDPYKQWKLSAADLDARKKWSHYVEAVDVAMKRTHLPHAPWDLIAADNKHAARESELTLLTSRLRRHREWIEREAKALRRKVSRSSRT